jgi:8-oxo-dGTP pyrophosphatase MutT (NUDIX family)
MDRLDALLAAVVPADDKERADLALMRAQRALLPEPLSRSQPAAHFTGSAVVTDGRRVALVHHRKLGRWLQPGGHVEANDGDDLLATALREAAEETGCPWTWMSIRSPAVAPSPPTFTWTSVSW